MDLEKRKQAFIRLGKVLRDYTYGEPGNDISETKAGKLLHQATEKASITNPWFTSFYIREALRSIGESLRREHLDKWTDQYPELKKQTGTPQKIGVVNAGNIPLVGFHDFLSVILSGHIYYGKLSSKDEHLPKAIAGILTETEPELKERIIFESKFLKQFDAIIATGGNNTSRYFHYYFGKYPHIIRRNRNAIAVLTGEEKDEELARLGDDIFLYFGMGCRNVSKLYLPKGFDINRLLNNIVDYRFVMDHHKYANNYDYNKAIYTMNQAPHLDNGFLLLREDEPIPSPIAALHYERYDDLNQVKNMLDQKQEQIQCIVTRSREFPEGVNFGKAQYPALWDYADNIDTMRFLLSLNNRA
ncbi:MAG: hypothetical protein KGY69_08610 [Bacteroidales bacterium]|nr:hypothetical protein [Bacteroidales bacterium]